MPCKDHVWKIGPYVDGELPGGEREAVEAHLRKCRDCEKMAAEFHTLDALGGRGEVPAVSGEEWSRILEAITRQSQLEATSTRRPTWEWLVPVVSLAALLLFGVFFTRGLFEPSSGTSGSTAGRPEKPDPVILDKGERPDKDRPSTETSPSREFIDK